MHRNFYHSPTILIRNGIAVFFSTRPSKKSSEES